MPYRNTLFVPEEHYHICVRGNQQQNIFASDSDRQRMLFLITHLQSPLVFQHVGRILSEYSASPQWNIPPETIQAISSSRYVALEAFAFMTNHIHLMVREVEEGGITHYMQRILNAYAKYFNSKYETRGHLFQGPFTAVHIETNEQLTYLSTYIHRNPRELPGMKGREDTYAWSSYQDYVKTNRFGNLLDTNIVLEQFKNGKDYRDFCNSSIAKETASEF